MAEQILAVGAHPDDIEIGCGGTLALHIAAGADVTMLVMTFGQSGPGDADRRGEAVAAARYLGADVVFGGLEDLTVTTQAETVRLIESVIDDVEPTLIYTHAESDSHQDHRATAAATISAARQRPSVLHYQSPSSRAFHPSLFVDIESSLEAKEAALALHASQVEGSAMVDLESQEVVAAYWGRQARCRYAEPYEVTRVRVRIGMDGRLEAE